MKSSEVVERAFAMPLTSPAYPPGPYRFIDREYFIVTYHSDADILEALVPEPLQLTEPLVSSSSLCACLIRPALAIIANRDS